MSSMSRRKSRRVSSGRALFFSTFATAPSVYVLNREPRAPVERDRARAPGAVGRRAPAADGGGRREVRPRRGAARPGPAVPQRRAAASLLRLAPRRRAGPGRDPAAPATARPRADPRQARARQRRGGGGSGGGRADDARGVLGGAPREAPARLERPLRGGGAPLDGLSRAGRAPDGAAQPAPRRRQARAALPLRAHVRLRRLAGDGLPLLRALRLGAHPRPDADPARARGHRPGADAGPGLAPRRPHHLMADPVSWLLIAEGWEV